LPVDHLCRPSRKEVTGPTGRKRWMIRVYRCSCGRIMRNYRDDLTWEQYCWVRRINARIQNWRLSG
jgi:hypothetical protein